jgi:DNA-binding transcriptional MerR regulator
MYTLDELAAAAAAALADGYDGQESGRVREIPDPRTIRYYTTLGLIDRAAEMRGRTALYNERHLLQLVAIKRLQARGVSLAEIQQRLPGLSDAKLREIAAIGERKSKPRSRAARPYPRADAEVGRRPTPHEAMPQGAGVGWQPTPHRPAQHSAPSTQHSTEPDTYAVVKLTDGVMLLVDAHQLPDEFDTEAIRAAAAPLIKVLETRRIRRRRTS